MQLEGSPAVEAANDKFSATMENKVRWGSSAEAGLLELRSDTSIQVTLLPCSSCLPCSEADLHLPDGTTCLILNAASPMAR